MVAHDAVFYRPWSQTLDRQPGWDETDSRDFIDLGRFFVPDREEQIAAVLDLIPDPGDGLLVDLCCGEGLLSRALLERFPRARVLALDLSPAMLAQARATCAVHHDRFDTRPFDLADRSWRPGHSRSRCAPSSARSPSIISTARASAGSSATSPPPSRRGAPW